MFDDNDVIHKKTRGVSFRKFATKDEKDAVLDFIGNAKRVAEGMIVQARHNHAGEGFAFIQNQVECWRSMVKVCNWMESVARKLNVKG